MPVRTAQASAPIRRSLAATDGLAELVRGFSSAGRAVALQASGHRFDPDKLHHSPRKPRDEDTSSAVAIQRFMGGKSSLFDIVNGFLKSMP